ncbi:MAG: LegC family aminotransferase [Deltaproteobacteria bacterium]
MNALSSAIVEQLQDVLGHPTEFIPLHEPRFGKNESRYVQECLESTFVSSVGQFVDRLEASLAEYTESRDAVAVVNGTCALQVALQLAGVQRDDEVLVPTLSFVATANAVHYCGAVPHFVDSDEETLGMDPEALEEWLQQVAEPTQGVFRNRQTGRRLRALVPMHTFGHPCDLEGLLKIAKDYRLELVEDAAESLGSYYHGQHTGTFGRLGTLSFNGNKTITTGGGGAILTQNPELARHAKHLTTTAKLPHRWDYMHDEVGFNYRMPNLNAALGCAQLEQLPDFLASKRTLFLRYQQAFQDIPEVAFIQEPPECQSNYWLQTLKLSDSVANERDAILAATNDAGLMTRPVWKLLHTLPPYRDCPRAPLPVAESLEQRLINLPSSAGLAPRG